jgi:LmbE family N-acetylglucosaminyl deacetylase
MAQTITVYWNATTEVYMVTWRRANNEAMAAALEATTRRGALAEAAEALGVDPKAILWGGVSAA